MVIGYSTKNFRRNKRTGKNFSTVSHKLANRLETSSTRRVIPLSSRQHFNKRNMNMKKLFSFQSLEHDWNGNGATPFDLQLIMKCQEILYRLVPQPDIFPTARQSIQFEYEKSNGEYLEFEVFNNEIHMLQVDENDKEWEEIIPFDQQKKIIDNVMSFYERNN